MSQQWITQKALIVVRTYPSPATKGVEVSCTAAISEQGQWLRLFPVPYRFLADDKRFKKYQWIEVSTRRSSDSRSESYHINIDTLKVVSDVLPTDNAWSSRKKLVFPLKSRSLCDLVRQRDAKGSPTLGLFKPASIQRLVISEVEANWTQEQLQKLTYEGLFDEGPKEPLEKVPYDFKYQFLCDETSCTGHEIKCIDWEMGESWRSWRDKYGDQWESKFRLRYETEIIGKYDTHFFVGTVKAHPNRWVIIGLFYPPVETQLGMDFDL